MNNTSGLCFIALDTATQACSAAVLCGEKAVLRKNEAGSGHSESLIGMADAALKEAGVRLADCAAVVFGAGPGAFTGLRVACGVAQGFAWAAEKPAVCAGNLEALALKCLKQAAPGTKILVALDARMHESYCAVYEKTAEDARPSELSSPQLVCPEDLSGIVSEFSVSAAAGSALKAFPEVFEPLQIEKMPEAEADALDIARLGELMFRAGETVIPELAAPLYVRNRVALTIEQRAAGEKL